MYAIGHNNSVNQICSYVNEAPVTLEVDTIYSGGPDISLRAKKHIIDHYLGGDEVSFTQRMEQGALNICRYFIALESYEIEEGGLYYFNPVTGSRIMFCRKDCSLGKADYPEICDTSCADAYKQLQECKYPSFNNP